MTCGSVDLQVMCNGKERTKKQWHSLFEEAGFTIKEIVEGHSMAAIVAVPSSTSV